VPWLALEQRPAGVLGAFSNQDLPDLIVLFTGVRKIPHLDGIWPVVIDKVLKPIRSIHES
jgi:hypothetical protein